MKTEPIVDSPMNNALAALAEAFAQAKRALVNGRDEPLAASEKRCRELEAKITALESAAITQSQALDDERARRTTAEKRFTDLDARVKEAGAARVKEREELNVAEEKLRKDTAVLKEGQAQLEAAQMKLHAEKRATVTNLKRSVAEMEKGLDEADRQMEPLPKKQKSDPPLPLRDAPRKPPSWPNKFPVARPFGPTLMPARRELSVLDDEDVPYTPERHRFVETWLQRLHSGR
ncbi:hypothetical protein C8R46DRAFT_1343963 [Mycena filopes]|nr:hypothetical protein C8R46DRAFT_1343963 [Mycena filopes]